MPKGIDQLNGGGCCNLSHKLCLDLVNESTFPVVESVFEWCNDSNYNSCKSLRQVEVYQLLSNSFRRNIVDPLVKELSTKTYQW